MKRTLFAIVFGALSFLIIADIAAGYYHLGGAPVLGTRVRVDSSRSVFTAVTAAGTAAGIHAGDILDLRRIDPATRLYLTTGMLGEAGTVYVLPLERDGRIVTARIPFQPQGRLTLDVLDVVMRVLLATAGLLLIARGVERDSFWAGLFAIGLAVFEGFGERYWGAPAVAASVKLFVLTVYTFASFGGRLLFAFALLPKTVPRWLRGGLIATGSAAFVMLCVATVMLIVAVLSGTAVSAAQHSLHYASEWTIDVISIAALGVSALYVDGQRGRAIGWMFGAMLVSQIGPFINFAYSISDKPLPFDGLLNVTFIALAIVLPYAVLSQRLLAVNFVVTRALVYTIVLTVVVGIFILLEKGIERAALGRIQSQAFELLVPLGLGLSMKWIERWAERIVERALYRRKLRAEHELSALVEDFPHARDVQGLSMRVAREICRQMDASFVCVYRESGLTYSPIAAAGNGESLPVDADDPVFMRLRSKHAVLHSDDFATALPRHSAVFPLVVFGAVTGALVVQSRAFGEAYDPDELDTLKRVAHELAIALLWVERAPASAAVVARA